MTTLITGGAGFLGSALVRRLCAEGDEVRVLDDMSRGEPQHLAGTGCQVVYGDVRDAGAVRRAMRGCRRVVHAAYINGTAEFYADPRRVLDVALNGMMSVLDACEYTGCGDLLLLSSSEVYQSAPVVPTPEMRPKRPMSCGHHRLCRVSSRSIVPIGALAAEASPSTTLSQK